ncbi:indolepyruvate ferredoxin oxidoreductase subunit alpha [Desulfobacter latus]|uniref:4Fe-4S binding protein n=1 Tax=Desulfobacter latus TaxID=2292 RepID=A0A850SZS2_9BACT|nr:4Fe-4S binding protein [Desulfobacter latus]NWH06769.1 4Fe-4S binding protein [Desulfobacter latus]
MPWIKKESCTGCGICVDACPAGAIGMENDIAFIKDDACIRCGICHDVCPEDAARHDGERIPDEVQSNLDYARKLFAHEYYANDKAKQKQLIERLKRFFTKNKKVAEKTIEELEILKNTEYL